MKHPYPEFVSILSDLLNISEKKAAEFLLGYMGSSIDSINRNHFMRLLRNITQEEAETFFNKTDAKRLVAAVRLGSHVYAEPEKIYPIEDCSGCIRALRPLLINQEQECVAVIALNQKLEPISTRILTVGTRSETIVDNTVLSRWLVLINAHHFEIVHNHPSGRCQPSLQDIEFTKNLIALGNLINVEMIDHIIVGDQETASIRLLYSGLWNDGP
jgi:DNA repair protein RadC